VQPYLISWFKYLPSQEFAKLTMPTLIIQGTTDIQVNVDEARGLRTAKPNSNLVLVSGMNHVLKNVGDDRAKQMASYSDPTLPIAAEVPRAIAAFVQGLKK
jgi:pimeloyl-ACP methyl ester carboxylesterase